ncbi:MAG: ATP-dependent Clp protease adapter ClpS [Planctomycetota bacterium]
MPEPALLPGVDTETRTALAPPWNVVVHDDPITLMSYVTMVFRRLFGYPYGEAHRLMMEVHTKGRAIVWTGAREQAELYVHKLHAAQLLATMEPVEA